MRFLYPWAGVGLLLVGGLLWWLRRRGSGRVGPERAAFGMRALALVALVAALAGPQVASRQSLRYVYFVVDRSASAAQALSVDEVLQAIQQFVRPQERVRYGLIVFGTEAYVDQPLSATPPQTLLTEVDPAGSNLAGALRLVLETLPPGPPVEEPGRAEVVLFSDGQVEPASLAGVLERVRRAGVRVWSYPLGKARVAEARLDGVELPRKVSPGAAFEGTVHLHATEPMTGTLLIYRDGGLLGAQPLALEPGSNAVRFSDSLEEPGRHRYQVYLKAKGDTLLENNAASDLVTVSGGAAVLVLEREAGAGAGLVRLLNASGYEADRWPLGRQDLSLGELAAYKAVVLDNVALATLSAGTIDALRSYAGQLGGGLWVIEGQRALAEVSASPLEELLPVSYQGPQQQQLPGVAIIFVLDRSSSMGQSVAPGETQSKLDVLKQAAAASVEILQPDDWVGIVMFDSLHAWLVEPGPLGDKRPVYEKIRQMFAGGGTDLFPPLREATDRLQSVPSRVKHILVFSDGKTVRQGRDFEALFSRLRDSDITVSSIGFGQQPDEELLSRLAEAGHGQFFRVKDARELPQISVRETRRVAQRRWVIGDFQTGPGPYALTRLSGLEVGSLPGLGGYVRTYAKPLAQVALEVEGDPLLGFWRYGLGQVAVLNTDLEGQWTGDWLAWPRLSELVGEVISQLFANPRADAGLRVHPQLDEAGLALTLDAQDGQRWVDLLEVSGRLVPEAGGGPPDGEAGQDLRFEQVAPGRYRAQLDPVPAGVYLVRLEARAQDGPAAQQTQALSVPYPREYQTVGLNEAALRTISAATGGALLEDERLDFGPPAPAGPVGYHDLWPWGLALSLGLFVGDLVLRKLP